MCARTHACLHASQGRLTYDDADPKMSSTQFVKLAQDLGLVQPNGARGGGGRAARCSETVLHGRAAGWL